MQVYRDLRGFLRQTLTIQSRPRKTPKHSDSHSKDWTKTQRHRWPHLKEENRHQCRNSSNTLKRNMVTPEPSSHTTGRLDHPNTEVEENNFKCNFMKMMETFKQEVKNSFKEMEEKTNKS